MSALRDFIADLSFTDARTFLQTGNVVFRGEARSAGDLEQLLEMEAKAHLGLTATLLLRSPVCIVCSKHRWPAKRGVPTLLDFRDDNFLAFSEEAAGDYLHRIRPTMR